MDTTARKAKSDTISVGQSLQTTVSSSLYVFVTLMIAHPSSVSRTSLARNETLGQRFESARRLSSTSRPALRHGSSDSDRVAFPAARRVHLGHVT